jgi:hypothetical protein
MKNKTGKIIGVIAIITLVTGLMISCTKCSYCAGTGYDGRCKQCDGKGWHFYGQGGKK